MKMNLKTICFVCLLTIYPLSCFANVDFFRDFTINMSKNDVIKLGAEPCDGDLCMSLEIENAEFSSLFNFIQNKLAAAVITSKKDALHYAAIRELMDKSPYIPVYIEVNSEVCDISELIKIGLTYSEALDRFMALTDKITDNAHIVMIYTDSKTLDKVIAKKDVIDNADIIAPTGPIVVFMNDNENGISLLHTQFALLNSL